MANIKLTIRNIDEKFIEGFKAGIELVLHILDNELLEEQRYIIEEILEQAIHHEKMALHKKEMDSFKKDI